MSVVSGIVSYELALVVLAATALAHVANRMSQPPVVAYLLTGIGLGPAVIDVVSRSGFTEFSSELGLAFLLFFIGMEIDLGQIREISGDVLKIGSIQMLSVFGIGAAVSILLEFSLLESAVLGTAFAFSSTAVVVKLLADNDELAALHGKLDTGILLVQDVVVVIALTLVSSGSDLVSAANATLGVSAMIVIVAPVAVYLSRNVMDPWFRRISGSPHLFFVYGIAWLLIMIELSSFLGASVEIGAFVAGLSIAQIPYSSELEHRIKPLTDLFMALFFVNVGLGLSGSTFSALNEAILASLVLIPGKFLIYFLLIDRSNFTPETAFRSSIGMVQVSEFALVLGAAAFASGLIQSYTLEFLTLTSILTIAISTYLLKYSEKISELAKPALDVASTEGGREPSIEKLSGHVLIVGYDEIGRAVAHGAGDREVVVVDRNPDKVEELSKGPHEYIYGDFRHPEIRDAARLGEASLVVCSAPGRDLNEKVVKDAEGEVIFVTALDEERAAELYDLGAHYVIMDEREAADALAELVEISIEDPGKFREKVEKINSNAVWGGRESH